MPIRSSLALLLAIGLSSAASATHEYLVRFRSSDPVGPRNFLRRNGGQLELVSEDGHLYRWASSQHINFTWGGEVQYVQRNFEVHILQNPSRETQKVALAETLRHRGRLGLGLDTPVLPDNPEIQPPPPEKAGADPFLTAQWALKAIGADVAYAHTNRGKGIVVAVLDTGIDYNHEDLIANIWHNPGEIPNNGLDDDHNGLVDDVIGWDFASKDNRPYDLTSSLEDILLQGGNPGHGTHCAGVIGARLDNSVGGAGVAPDVKLMPVRFTGPNGKGDDVATVQAIDYAVKNGAKIINASWGSEKGDSDDAALREAIERARDKGVIFVAAAGNGRMDPQTMQSVGYNNDTDPKPMMPASLPLSNIVSVAAIDPEGQLAPFSNWGEKTVKLAAPGVKIFSTVPGNRYQDTILDLGGMRASWDGTSMAAPFVTGALAVMWSEDPKASADEIIEKLLSTVTPLDSLKGKVATGGRVSLKSLGE